MTEETDKEEYEEDSGETFYANHLVFNVAGEEVHIDFQKLSVRFAPADFTKSYKTLDHNTVILDLTLFKQLLNSGEKIIQEFEKKFGPIKSPEYIENMKREQEEMFKRLELEAKEEEERKLKELEEKTKEKQPYFG